MEKVGFIGAYDKIDCILYIAKILRTVGKKVLVVDSTINQKAKYIVPVIYPTVSYVTEFEEMDVAVGFEDFDAIKNYLGVPEQNELDYDYALVDIDRAGALIDFEINPTDQNYFVTAFDLYSLKRGLEILNNVQEPYNLTKVLFSKDMTKEEDDYLNFLSLGLKIVWDENRVYFPLENGDSLVIAESQRLSKIRFRQLSIQYKDSLMFIAEQILKDTNGSQIRKAMKNIEKGA